MDKKASPPINTTIDSFRRSLKVTCCHSTENCGENRTGVFCPCFAQRSHNQFNIDTFPNEIIHCAQVNGREKNSNEQIRQAAEA